MSPAIAAETETLWPVNISPEKWLPRNRTYFGSLEVRSPEAGEAYAVTPIRGCKGFIDMGDRRTIDYRVTARRLLTILRRKLTEIREREVSTGFLCRRRQSRVSRNLRTRDGNCRNFSGGWWQPRTWNGNAARIPRSLPTWNGGRAPTGSGKSPPCQPPKNLISHPWCIHYSERQIELAQSQYRRKDCY